MSKGYIVIAQNNNEFDYLEMTYALALSLKATQQENAICVCVDEHTSSLVQDKHRKVFEGTNSSSLNFFSTRPCNIELSPTE